MEETPIQAQAPAPAPAAAPAPKKSNGMLLGLVFCLILAAGGVGFGIFEMLDSNNKSKESSDLNSKIVSLNNEIAELKKDAKSDTKPTITKPSATEPDVTDCLESVDSSSAVSEDYIYITEWGMKIKKPSNAIDLIGSYQFFNDYPMAVDTFEIVEKTSDYGKMMISPTGQESIESCKAMYGDDITCFELGGKVYTVQEGKGGLAPGENPHASDEFRNYFLDSSIYSEI